MQALNVAVMFVMYASFPPSLKVLGHTGACNAVDGYLPVVTELHVIQYPPEVGRLPLAQAPRTKQLLVHRVR